MMWHNQIEVCTNAANISAVWRQWKLSEKDAKIIKRTDGERLFSTASHIFHEKRTGGVMLVNCHQMALND